MWKWINTVSLPLVFISAGVNCMHRYVFPVLSKTAWLCFLRVTQNKLFWEMSQNTVIFLFIFSYNMSNDMWLSKWWQNVNFWRNCPFKSSFFKTPQLKKKKKKVIVQQLVNYTAIYLFKKLLKLIIQNYFYGNKPVRTRMGAHIVKGCMPKAAG